MKTLSVMTVVLFGVALAGCGQDDNGNGGDRGSSGSAGAWVKAVPPPPPSTTTDPASAAGVAGSSGTAGAAMPNTGFGGEGGTDAGAAGAGGAAVQPINQFIGTWKYTAGTVTRICAGQGDIFQLTGEDQEFAHSVDGGLILKGDCALKLSIAGDSASAADGATCTSVNDDGSSSTVMYSSLLFTTTDGRVMTVSASGTITFLESGASIACTFSTTGNLMKYAE